MFHHSGINVGKHCYGCTFYGADRELKNRGIECERSGTCLNPKSTNKGKKVSDLNGCYWFSLWDVISSEIENEKRKKQEEREAKIEADKNAKIAEEKARLERYEIERERRRLEEERKKLEEERKSLEYGKWYMLLSAEEKAAEDERVAKEEEEKRRQEELERIRKQQEAEERRIRLAQEEKQRALDRKKSKKIIFWIMTIGTLVIALTITLSIVIFNFISDSKHKKIDEFLSQYTNNTYTEIVTINGITKTSSFTSTGKGQYYVSIKVPITYDDNTSEELSTSFYFYYGSVKSGSEVVDAWLTSGSIYDFNNYSYAHVKFTGFTFGTCPTVNNNYKYKISYSKHKNLSSSEIEFLWASCTNTIKFADEVLKKADSSYSLW